MGIVICAKHYADSRELVSCHECVEVERDRLLAVQKVSLKAIEGLRAEVERLRKAAKENA